jgi:hypothetical protein
MSWLSKWWNGGGQDLLRDALRKALGDRAKRQALEKLRLLLKLLDEADTATLRREIVGMIEYVEAL